jgi:hypothetical protein
LIPQEALRHEPIRLKEKLPSSGRVYSVLVYLVRKFWQLAKELLLRYIQSLHSATDTQEVHQIESDQKLVQHQKRE